ncbi:hypothetical protein [Nostocoides sp. HKS02]|nr:hypothetical protein [Tetrasphaera sp. HKS02]QGN58657.1 hypothetical protein GKE56_13100 [Tetrasphaera sp. HKS02]
MRLPVVCRVVTSALLSVPLLATTAFAVPALPEHLPADPPAPCPRRPPR